MILRHFFVFSLLLLLLSPAGLVAQEHPQCSLCGMDLNKYTHVRYTVTTTSGQQITTCGVQCGLLLQLNLGADFKSAVATDLLYHRTIPAEKAWYVYRSKIITDMAPGFIAFASRDHADRFAKSFGGKVLTLQQAIDAVKGGFK
ncbi:MAG: nitrous oxide reductase accessory protein NosL [Deltaproteobacteria bacterium]|nr:nitrous oxide reductase accessory protein NosL [Deltaproteobacteria bacterium]